MGQAQSTEDVATEETVAATSEATATVDETEETALASEKGKVEEEPEAPAPATTAEPSDHGPQPDSVSEPHAPVETIPGDDNEPEDVSMQMENEPEDASMQSESPERDEDVEGELRQLDDADGPSAAAPDDAPDTQDATGGIDNTATTMTATEQDVVSLTGRDSEVQSPDVNVDGSVVPEQISVGLDDSNPDPGVGSTREVHFVSFSPRGPSHLTWGNRNAQTSPMADARARAAVASRPMKVRCDGSATSDTTPGSTAK